EVSSKADFASTEKAAPWNCSPGSRSAWTRTRSIAGRSTGDSPGSGYSVDNPDSAGDWGTRGLGDSVAAQIRCGELARAESPSPQGPGPRRVLDQGYVDAST